MAANLAIYSGGDFVVRERVKFRFDPWTYRTERVKTLGASPLTVGEHHIASRHVIRDGVSEHDVRPILFVDAVGDFTDDDGEFPFVHDSPLDRRQHDRVARPDDGGRRLEKNQGRWGSIVMHLGGVLSEVHPDTHDLGRGNGGQRSDVRERDSVARSMDSVVNRVTLDQHHVVALNQPITELTVVLKPDNLHLTSLVPQTVSHSVS